MIIDASLIGHRRQAHAPSALELPEIVSYVARYVPLRALPACARVSKLWYQACVPFIWENVSLNTTDPGSLEAIKGHNHFVKTLTIGSLTPECAGLRFPNLMSLLVHHVKAEEHADFIFNHPDIATLNLLYFKSDLEFALWSTVHGFRHLRKLRLSGLVMDKKDTDAFWQICTLLESGKFHDVRVADPSGLLCMEFPRMKELKVMGFLSSDNAVPLPLEFARRCPRLESCNWEEEEYLPSFIQLVAAKSWPNLHSVGIWTVMITGDQLFEILGGMQRITSLNIHCDPDDFTPRSMALLRPQFSNLRVLDLKKCNQSIVCSMAQEILSSCPLLETFVSTWIDADLVANGKPWVCLGLKVLELGFVFNPPTLPVVQPMVFDQLSKLTRLEYWRLWSPFEKKVPEDVMKLKLEYGLDKLQTLRALRILTFGFSGQEMEDQEIDWMLEHWTSLGTIRGQLCSVERRKRAMTKRLNEQGVGHLH